MILAQWNARRQAEAMVSAASLEIQRLKLLLAKARREVFGQASERSKRLLDQLELQLAELEEAAAEDEGQPRSRPPRPGRWCPSTSGRSRRGGPCRRICQGSGS